VAADRSSRARGPARTPQRGGNSPWRLGNWRLRTKLAVVLLVPLLLAAVLGWLRVATAAQSASDLDDLVARVGLGQQLSELTDQLQDERTRAAAFVGSNRRTFRPELDRQIAQVDAAMGVLSNSAPEDFGPAATDVARTAQIRLQGLTNLRQAVTDTRYPAAQVISAYSGMVDALRTLDRAVFTTPDLQLQRQANDVVAISDVKEQVQREHAALLPILLNTGGTAPDQAVTRSSAAQLDAAVSQFGASGLPGARDLYAQTVSGPDVDGRERIETSTLTALNTGNPVVAGGSAAAAVTDWDTAAQGTADKVRQVEVQLQERMRSDGTALAATAGSQALRDGVIVAALVLLALLLLLLVTRAILRPLRTLRSSAFDIAQRRLPQAIEELQDPETQQSAMAVQPIDVHTSEEIGEVARAFDAVHAEAIRLAGEQALLRANVNDIFVNLSRRSQGLVKRQLGLIDKLESDEQDPDHLGDLFQLDHLATRMRRNNENLLVLAGAAELRPRRRRPVPTEDVLRASVSEVEDYQRVVVRRAPAVSLAGPAVNDLVHLMAELLDNATSFSPPESTVVLSSTLDAGNGLVIEISDSGVGIEPPALRVINAELADPPTVDAAVSRRMGLFVVGRLAQRNNIHVQLQAAPVGQGTIAVVTVPATLLMTAAQAAAAEMATSEFPASTGPSTGSWAIPERGAPAPRGSSRPAGPVGSPEPSLARAVPAPRQPKDPGVGGWAEFEIGGPPPQRQPAARRQERARPPQGNPQTGPQTGPHTGPQPGPRPGPQTGPQSRFPTGPQPTQPPQPRPAPAMPAPPPSQPARPSEPAAADLFSPAPAAPGAGETSDESPIYDEVRTSWFRMDQVTGTGSTPAAGSGRGAHSAAVDPAGDADRGPSGQPDSRSGGAHRPAGEPDARSVEPVPTAEPERTRQDDRPTPASTPARPAPNGNGAAGGNSNGNGSSNGNGNGASGHGEQADPSAAEISASEWGPTENGWRAAREFTELTREFLTDAGLPKRRAGSRPLPGSFGDNPPSGGASARNPDAVRGRLREYQRGLRHGRYAQTDVAEPSASSTGAQE
jgi:signal transduction histidine kinase